MSDFVSGLFSIIVPTHNRANLITEALDSVKVQTYRPIEIIVIDDGSTDETRNVVEDWAKQGNEPNFLLLRYFYQENGGPAAARNFGITKIRGEFVQFLDSDDRIHPQRLEKLVGAFEISGADFIQTGFDGFDSETEEIIEQHYARPDESQAELALRGLLWANTLRSAFRCSLVEKIGPWEEFMTCFEDREYVERAVLRADNPIAVREILASARRGGSKRVSDRLRSYEGRKFRILCEERLASSVRDNANIGYAAKQAFASRLYALGFRSNASGWPDHGLRCGEIAESLRVKLDKKGKTRRLVWKSGRVGGVVYGAISNLKHYLSNG